MPALRAERAIQVWRRTVERLLDEIELAGADEDGVAMVVPGAPLEGRVVVTTPSGTPVRGAAVELRVRPDAEPTTLTTGADGAASFDVRAPAYLAGDVGSQQLVARVVHPAHGTITASATYLMTRVAAVVSVTPRGGALVPEVEQTLYVHAGDPRGRPLAEGTEVVVRGEGIDGGEATAAIDDEGYAEITVALPRGAASTMRTGACAGRVATTFAVEVRTDPPRFCRVCATVAPDAEVAPVLAGSPIVGPGAGLEVAIRRRPSVRGRAVLVEALFEGRAVAATWIDGRGARGALELPADLLGRVTLRARAARDEDATEATSEPGRRGSASAPSTRCSSGPRTRSRSTSRRPSPSTSSANAPPSPSPRAARRRRTGGARSSCAIRRPTAARSAGI